MKTIFEKFKSGKITAKEAYSEINQKLETASDSDKKKLIELSNRIMDRELPLEERNNDVESAYQAMTTKE